MCAEKGRNRKPDSHSRKLWANHESPWIEKALSRLERNCTDEELLQKRRSKIKDKENDVKKAEEELAAARASGKEHKIVKSRTSLPNKNASWKRSFRGIDF